MLSIFSIVAAVDVNGGIGFQGTIPWLDTEYNDLKQFKALTMGGFCIMGRKTYESIKRPLPGRQTIIISRFASVNSKNSEDLTEANLIFTTLFQALEYCYGKGKPVFVCGGQEIYREALETYGYLCVNKHITKIPVAFPADRYFPMHLLEQKHEEYQYLDSLRYVLTHGQKVPDRTGTGTISCFGLPRMAFDLRKGFPLITTKRMSFKVVKEEFQFMWSGKTDCKLLAAQGVHIWDGNTSAEFLTKSGLPWREGDMGPSYGFQWRHWGATYQGCDVDYNSSGIDQIEMLINGIRINPSSRRHIISGWNVADIPNMALPPCHCLFQCYVGFENDKPVWLDGQLYQRSADMFLGVPYNIAFYSLMLHHVAKQTNLIPRMFYHTMGDSHIYNNHIQHVQIQLERIPFPFPTLSIDNYKVDNYKCHSAIKATMAV